MSEGADRKTTLGHIQTGNPDVDRVQRETAARLNPILRSLPDFSTVPEVTGAKGGNTALASLLSALAGMGMIKDSTT